MNESRRNPNKLQNTATHRNTLQYTSTHPTHRNAKRINMQKTLQHIALQHTATHFAAADCDTVKSERRTP